jgi:Protein of unknown function (DUF2591)
MREPVKTSDLEGAQLDYWVARAEGLSNPRVEDGLCWVAYVDCDNKREKSVEVDAAFSPSTDWAQAGPIIEREDYCLPRVNTNAGGLHHGGYAASTPGMPKQTELKLATPVRQRDYVDAQKARALALKRADSERAQKRRENEPASMSTRASGVLSVRMVRWGQVT